MLQDTLLVLLLLCTLSGIRVHCTTKHSDTYCSALAYIFYTIPHTTEVNIQPPIAEATFSSSPTQHSSYFIHTGVGAAAARTRLETHSPVVCSCSVGCIGAITYTPYPQVATHLHSLLTQLIAAHRQGSHSIWEGGQMQHLYVYTYMHTQTHE